MRHVSVKEHHTAIDWAEEIRYLVDVSYPDCDKIILVMDNLNTHALSSLYKAFPAPEARRIADISLLRQELAAWESNRNEYTVCMQWQFTTAKARTKLVSLYPKICSYKGKSI